VLDILILHSTRDRALAAALAADFKATGFTAGYDQGLIKRQSSPEETAARLREARAVVAIWTHDSVASELVRAEAGKAQELGKLISVRVPELAQSALPAGFWPNRVFVLNDRQPLYRAIRDMNAAQAPRGAPAPMAAGDAKRAALQSLKRRTEALDMPVSASAPAPAPARETSLRSLAAAAQEAAIFGPAAAAAPEPAPEVQPGKLVENVPRFMRAGVPVEVEVRLSRRETEALIAGLGGDVRWHDIMTTPAMTVTLQAPMGGFTIQALSRETQWIDGGQKAQLGLLGQAEYGAWKWIVTPVSAGRRKLNIVAAAKTSGGGIQAETPLPEQIVEVKVRVNYVRAFGGLVKWLAVAAAGGLVAEYASTLLKLATNALHTGA
jgi:hypothetical protein